MLLRRYHGRYNENKERQTLTSVDFNALTVDELKEEAKGRGIEGYSTLKKAELVKALKG